MRGGSTFAGFVAGIAALGGLLFGYDTGIISSALLYISRAFGLGPTGEQLVTSAILVGALVGCMAAGPVSDRLGRRPTVMAAACVFIGGSFAAALAPSTVLLWAARFVLGLAVGAATQIVPVYIAELAPARRRGALVVLFQLAVVSGVTLSYVVGYFLAGAGDWRSMFALGAVPAVILLLGMLPLPESPRWLVLQGRRDAARAVLARLRASEAEVDEELEGIAETARAERGWGELRRRWLRPALVTGVGVAAFCQLTGVNAVVYYAPTIFTDAGFGDAAAILTSVGIGLVMVATTVFGTVMVDRWGRRRLLLRLLPGAALALVALGFAFLGPGPQGPTRWVAVVAIMAYIGFNVGSLSVAIWLIGAEVFPLSVRGKAASLVALTHWSCDLLVSLTTLTLAGALGTAGMFWLYAVVNALAVAFVWRCVPETRGRSLEEIEASLRRGRFAAAR